MGGKNKQAQRTKNNARPSSSGRSAELLGNNVPQFSGFSGIKESGFRMPTFSLPNTEDMDLEIDTNFQLVFKKMNKKDATTKLKALQEFADLVKNSEAEAVKAVLPFWPRLYNVLSTDSEHKVREATHIAHNEVVQKVKRNLAPHLKQLIAPWFTSQYDTYPPAASAATLSFNAAFPEKKIEEVIAFCNQEIINYIYDNLLNQTPQTVCNPKHNTAEDAEAKYARVLISSLHGYSLYLKKIQPDKIENFKELNRKIVSSSIFWKYSKHNLSIVRAAWYEVLTALFQKAPFLLDNEEGHVTATTLGNIDETDPVVLPLVWQNVLLTITSIKEWWTKVNIDKLMLPKLWKVLKEGGQGNAVVIYPNLLPLLSNLTLVIDENTFYNNFFQNLCSGLKRESVISSKSESTAVSTALVECLRYVIMKNESNTFLCEKLIKSHIMPTLEWCLLETQSCYKTIFNQTASLVQYWSRNNSAENPNYLRYLNYFWTNIDSLFQGVLMNLDSFESEKICNVSDRQIEFLQSMKQTAKIKKCLKVTFHSDSEMIGSDKTDNPSSHPDELYLASLTNLVFKICEAYVKLIDDKKSKELLDHLVALIQEFNSESFLLRISKQIDSEEENRIMVIFRHLLKNWLRCEALISKSLIDLIFMVYKYLEDEEKEIILQDLDEIKTDESFGWCLEEALSHQYNQDNLIQKWLRSDKVSNFFVNIVEKEIADECPSNLSALLKLAVTENEREELYVSHQAVAQIIQKLKEPLLKPTNYLTTIDTCASLAAYLSAVVYTDKLLLTFSDELLLTLFALSCNTNIDSDYLSTDSIWEAQTAWQDAFTVLSGSLPRSELETVLHKIVDIAHKSLDEQDSDDKNLEKLIDVLLGLCRAIYKGIPLEMDGIFNQLFKHAFITDWRNGLTDICKTAEYLGGKLASCYDEFKMESGVKMADNNLLKFFTWSYLKVNVLTANLDDYTPDEDDEDEKIDSVKIWSVLDSRIEWMSDLFYDFELALCFLENYGTVKFVPKIKEYNNQVSPKLSEVMETLKEDDKISLKESLRSKSYANCWMWCRSIYTICTNISQEEPAKVYEDLVKGATLDDKLLVVHATQIFAKHLDFDYVANTFDDVSRMVVLRSLCHCKEIDVQIAEVMSKLEIFRSDDVSRFYCESLKMEWQSYQMVVEATRLFNNLIKHQFDSLSRRYIDLIVICLAEWLPRLVQFCKTDKIQPMIISVTDLHQSLIDKINELKASNTKVALTKEWDDLFAEGILNDMVKLWHQLAGDLKNHQTSLLVTKYPLVYCFASMMDSFDYQLVFKPWEDKVPKWFKLLRISCSLLTSSVTTFQLAAYKVLMGLIPGLVEIDSTAVSSNTPNENGLIFGQFKGICVSMQEIINTMLIGLKLGEDSCRVEPFTDSYNFTLAYLLIWDVLLTFCEKSSTELKYQYADWLRQEDVLKNLFNNLFRLMPTEILYYSDSTKLFHPEWFAARVSLDVKDVADSKKLEHMVCWIYSLTLSQLPALVRQWWSGTETRIAQIVERITSTYVSPLLCNQELTDLSSHEKKFKNMTIKVMPTVREVVAVYTVDECQMELNIILPTNYPLGGPEVHCIRQIGGTSHKQWLMQFKKCVLHQNGRIWDGLSLWNNNLDKKFDGVEECYICFSVLHPGTYQLPKLSCQTCRKKFHSACLYKWFSTSIKSSCPICRNLF